jgi:ABC-type multidrug transport system fused ATPase/permease subunit
MIDVIKNIYTIVVKYNKNDFLLILFLMFFLSILEFLGLGIILPIINMLSNPNTELVTFINNIFSLNGYKVATIIILIGVVLFFILKSLYTLYTIKRQQIFVNRMFTDLSIKILEQIMFLKYEEFREKDKTLYLKDIINSSAYLSLCTFNILQFLNEIFVLMAILIFMGFYIGFFKVIIILIGILIIAYIFTFITKNISYYGQQRDIIMHNITKTAMEILSGYREIRNNNVLDNVIKIYSKKIKPYVDIYVKFGVFSNIPKITLETITALIIVGYIFYIIFSGMELHNALQNLIIFAFIGLRTIPSLIKILNASAQIKYFGSESDKFNKLFLINSLKFHYVKHIDTFNNKIEFKDISYKYPSKKDLSLTNINFVIEKNKKYGFVGKSGSGKSTLFDIILGLISPLNGKIIIDNEEYKTLENIDITRLIAVVSQSIFIVDGDFEDNILFFDDFKDISLYDEAISGAQLKDLIDDNKKDLVGEDGKNLSGGQKQRLAIARALYKNKDILLLDEATSALDNETERNFINYLNSKKKHTVLIIAHRLTTVKDCDKIFVLKKGTIVDSGTYEELSKNSEEFKRLLNSGEFNEE